MDRREEEAGAKRRRIKSKEDETITKFFEMIPLDLIKFFEMIPLDLIHEILLRLPAKSAARFRCVSKLWSSITTRPYFITSFATQSSTRLCLLVCVITREKRLFISLPQHEHSDRSYSHADRSTTNAPKIDNSTHPTSVQGLICFRGLCWNNIVVWNPTMRQHVTLPKPSPEVGYFSSCLGYDPVEDKYKVLCISMCRLQNPLVFTLGPQESWRVAQTIPKHSLISNEICICINGYVYYLARLPFNYEVILMRFNVRYENFNVIKKPADDKLSRLFISYQGKLAWVCYDFSCIRFWVLEDIEKQEWSTRRFPLPFPNIHVVDPIWGVSLALGGITHDSGEFIYWRIRCESVYVMYYDPKRNHIRRVKYEGIGYEDSTIHNVSCSFNHSESLVSLEDVSSLRE